MSSIHKNRAQLLFSNAIENVVELPMSSILLKSARANSDLSHDSRSRLRS